MIWTIASSVKDVHGWTIYICLALNTAPGVPVLPRTSSILTERMEK